MKIMDNKQKAQQRADQIRAFYDEVEQLDADQVLKFDAEQFDPVVSYHNALLDSLTEKFDIDISAQQKQLSTGMKIASFIGALALAASVFFLFYQFWGYFGTTLQVSILIAAPLFSLFATYWVSGREATGYFAKLLSMVSFTCFVLNLVMLGQIFNITPSENALLVWAAFAVLLAYAFDVRLLLAAGILSFAGFIAARVGTWSGMYWLSFGSRPENYLLPALIIFTVPLWLKQKRYSGFDPVYRVFGCLLFLFPVLVLSNWGYGSYLIWDAAVIEGSYQLLGFVISAGLIVLGIRQHWPDTINTGNAFFVLFLYTKMFDWWWDIMPKYLFFLVIALSSLLMLFIYKRIRLQSQLVEDSHA
ncbi:MAG: DUF2157 domain-containing protein [Gammaproteobacteria bacterium]|nr:DUF2157 domain-containing protein [Gammaproteobacteria bacterium]MCW8923666.1 DUF2157 domain-containing protein [Gammaproteobacteria bacterium]